MATVLFDTLTLVRELRPAFSQEQAEAPATAVAALRAGMIEVKAEWKGGIAAPKDDLVRRIDGAIAFDLPATGGLIITAMKLSS